MIYVEPREENISIITRGGVTTQAYQNAQHDQPQVQPKTKNKVPFKI